ncbi:hypothetical protein JGU66_15680 [Myxococcaceae bacterium JPH2]|nr:hypothetical protein [Myxococcaceae bacterium JPH2]
MTPLSTGQVAWYVTGRFYKSFEGWLEDLGYFIHLQGLDGPLFDAPPGAPPSESTALLTFRAEPFRSVSFTNGDLALSVDPVGEFSLFLRQRPGASFARPDSFSEGTRIATFRRASVVLGADFTEERKRALSLNVFTAKLVWSTEFEFQGRIHDLKRLLPHGITQWGEAGPTGVMPPTSRFTSVVPFIGSAVTVGP